MRSLRGPHFTRLLEGGALGSTQEHFRWGWGLRAPSQSWDCDSSLTLERVSQAWLPGTNYHCRSRPCLPGAPATLATGPIANSMYVCEHAGVGGTCVCGLMSVNTLCEWACVCSC